MTRKKSIKKLIVPGCIIILYGEAYSVLKCDKKTFSCFLISDKPEDVSEFYYNVPMSVYHYVDSNLTSDPHEL